ncbi:MAG: DUF1016 N-terminal domain-containing protein [Candidatus Methanoplasma sp.]|nr:DUF1016 N-terminal domain-containing protein [Candidatus Methanoplasma sp.]
MEIINEAVLFKCIASIIEDRKSRIESHVNAELTKMYREIGKYINSVISDGKHGEYGKQVLATLSPKLSWSHIVELLPLKTQEARMYSQRM